MSQARLNQPMVLNIYKEALDEMFLIQIANEYVSGSEDRHRIFGNNN